MIINSDLGKAQKKKCRDFIFLFAVIAFILPNFAYASVESSLMALQSLLLTRILPIFAVMSFGFASFHFFVGNQHAKEYFAWAIIGSAILFGAQSIVDLISRLVQ